MMKPIVHIIAAGLAIALAAPALPTAAAPKNKNQGNVAACPPGLAKKNPPCVPPGQVKNRNSQTYRIGDRIDRDYIIVEKPGRYGLNPNQTYYRVGDNVFRVNRETREVLEFIGAAAQLFD